MNSCGCASLWEWLKPSVSFLPPRIVSVCWPSWRIAIVRSNMCSVQRARQRLWQAHRLQPHRIRTFKRSNDPEFAEKVENIVGLYMDPPKHAVVVSIDEKSQ